MRVLLAIPASLVLSTLVLSGCAGYDRFAEPSASLALRHAMDRCVHSLPANDPKEHSDLTSCQLAAQRDFAVATRMKRMDVFETYAHEMQQVAADWDAKTLPRAQAFTRANEIQQDYLAKCDCTLGPTRPRWSNMFIPGPGPY